MKIEGKIAGPMFQRCSKRGRFWRLRWEKESFWWTFEA